MPTTEEALLKCISNLNNGVFKSQRAAAKAYRIPRSTLQGRLRGATDYEIAHQSQQRLSLDQEEFLVQQILEEDQRGYPPSHAQAREMATEILKMNRDHQPLGRLWISGFLRRNQRVASIIGRKIEA